VAAGSAVLLALGPAPFALAFQFDAAVYDEVKPSVVRVSCSDRTATGFLWTSADTAVTALHAVSGCTSITVYYEALRISRPASVTRVLRRADLALLKIANAPNGHVMVVETTQPSLTEPLSTLGYPLQVPSMQGTRLELRYGGRTLRDIVPESIAQQLAGGSPSLDLEIDSIEGHLLPGHSGAPIFNEQRRIVAIADGGLENGAAAISWGIPVKYLGQLAASTENTNVPHAAAGGAGGGGGNHVLFAAETEIRNRGEVTCSGLVLTKLRTTSFTQISRSVDDPLGMTQLVRFFGVDPSNFSYDVYQHLASGATFVVPAGAELSQNQSGDCTATDPTGHIEMRLQVGVLNSTMEAQSKSEAFERSLANGNTQNWIPDPQWTNAMPLTRFDGMIVRRRAYTHVKMFPVMFRDKYVFEALAVRNNVFIGSAAMYGWTPQYQQRVMACRMQPSGNGCAEIGTFMADWVRAVLAIQLTTFPVG
jgi:hypothetical protein